jgi:hypothetical protein
MVGGAVPEKVGGNFWIGEMSPRQISRIEGFETSADTCEQLAPVACTLCLPDVSGGRAVARRRCSNMLTGGSVHMHDDKVVCVTYLLNTLIEIS